MEVRRLWRLLQNFGEFFQFCRQVKKSTVLPFLLFSFFQNFTFRSDICEGASVDEFNEFLRFSIASDIRPQIWVNRSYLLKVLHSEGLTHWRSNQELKNYWRLKFVTFYNFQGPQLATDNCTNLDGALVDCTESKKSICFKNGKKWNKNTRYGHKIY